MSLVLDHMDESALLFRGKTGKDGGELAEMFLLVSMLLFAGFGHVVGKFDHRFEFATLSIKVLDKLRVHVFLIVELGDLLLHIVVAVDSAIEVSAGQLLEESEVIVVESRGVLGSLLKGEGKS